MPEPAASEEPAADRRAERRWERWLVLLLRLLIIALCAFIAGRLPLPIVDDWLPVRDVVVVVSAIVVSGKVLYDTFFYDHFWP